MAFTEDSIVNFGEGASLICTAAGIPAPQVLWYKDGGSPLTEDVNVTQLSTPNGYFVMSIVNLCNLSYSDSGRFSCVASNSISLGPIETNRSLNLEVHGKAGQTICLTSH